MTSPSVLVGGVQQVSSGANVPRRRFRSVIHHAPTLKTKAIKPVSAYPAAVEAFMTGRTGRSVRSIHGLGELEWEAAVRTALEIERRNRADCELRLEAISTGEAAEFREDARDLAAEMWEDLALPFGHREPRIPLKKAACVVGLGLLALAAALMPPIRAQVPRMAGMVRAALPMLKAFAGRLPMFVVLFDPRKAWRWITAKESA